MLLSWTIILSFFYKSAQHPDWHLRLIAVIDWVWFQMMSFVDYLGLACAQREVPVVVTCCRSLLAPSGLRTHWVKQPHIVDFKTHQKSRIHKLREGLNRSPPSWVGHEQVTRPYLNELRAVNSQRRRRPGSSVHCHTNTAGRASPSWKSTVPNGRLEVKVTPNVAVLSSEHDLR